MLINIYYSSVLNHKIKKTVIYYQNKDYYKKYLEKKLYKKFMSDNYQH